MKRHRGAPKSLVAAVFAIALGVTSSCSSSSGTGDGDAGTGGNVPSNSTVSTPTASDAGVGCEGTPTFTKVHVAVDPELAAQVPAEFKGKTLNIVTGAPAVPFEMFDSDHRLIGTDIQIGAATAALLGLKCKFTNISYDGIIPALQAHQYDFAITNMGDEADREKVVDFIDWYQYGVVLVVAKGNPEHITGLESMCGKTDAYLTGVNAAAEYGPGTHALCSAAGKPDMKLKALPNQGAQVLALKAHTVDALTVSYPGALALTQSAADIGDIVTPTGRPKGYFPTNSGSTFLKGSPLLTVMQAATQKLLENGTLKAIYSEYGIQDLLLQKVVANELENTTMFPPGITAN